MRKTHFFLGNKIAQTRDYVTRVVGRSENIPLHRDKMTQAENVKRQYENVVNRTLSVLDDRIRNNKPSADGIYLNLDMDQHYVPDKLGERDGATIMKVSEDKGEGNVDVTVFVRKDKKQWLSKKSDDYATKKTSKGNPKFSNIIDPINIVSSADIRSLYVSPEEFDLLDNERFHDFELWLFKNSEYDEKMVLQTLADLDICADLDKRLCFDGVDVWLIRTNKNKLCELPLSLSYIEGVRPYHQPSIMLSDNETSRDWSRLINQDVTFSVTENSPRVGILDSGVNNAHELLSEALPNERMDSAINVMDSMDHSHHGTGMAGLVLYGDLTNVAYQTSNPVIEHNLASVKIFENDHLSNHDFYGVIIEDAVNKAHGMGADIQCMAVTDDNAYDGTATSSSAALDESIYHNGDCDRMVIVSAGNIEPDDIDSTDYIQSCKANVIQSPAQAWNALTVGAYTEKTVTGDPGYVPIAPPGGLSPLSVSSYSWHRGVNKPEILMEGGNVSVHNVLGNCCNKDLSLITTSQDLSTKLETFNATSAATALAARLAAKIKVANPNLSMLSVRGLMVHSANWTCEMNRIDDKLERMNLCGYGVPDEAAALFSSERCATYIFENELKPYKPSSGSSNTYNQLHYYDLPWPSDLLLSMGEENVRVRITLSYYVKPSPGNGGWVNKYRYPSATLHFDIKTPVETTEEFLSRRNKNEGDCTSRNDSDRWVVKEQCRARGTVQSDWFECTAAEMAECGKIVVYPGPGWWKERKLQNVDNVVKYSLIVSVESEKTEIYDSIMSAIRNKVGVQIAQNI